MKKHIVSVALLGLISFIYANNSYEYITFTNFESNFQISDNGRYGEKSLAKTIVKSNNKITEVLTLSIDCLNSKKIPNISYLFRISDTKYNKLEWYKKISGEFTVIINGDLYKFGRTKAPENGFHYYQLLDNTNNMMLINSLNNANEIKVSDIKTFDGKNTRSIVLDTKNFSLNELKCLSK